jgi:hypothetical protein
MDTLHEELDYRKHYQGEPDDYQKAYHSLKEEFYGKGCAAFTFAINGPCAPADEASKDKAFISAALYSAFGDDLDGVASDMADLGW